MFKLQNNKIKFLIPIILILIGIIYCLFNKYYESDEYILNEDFILHGTNSIENQINQSKLEKDKVVIHITGEVYEEGVYELEEGARIIDAVKCAGGLTVEADTSKINLAYILKDGQKIVIPSSYDDIDEFVTNESCGNIIEENTQDNIININTASKEELKSLPGIGESTAQKIISYRNENGKFLNIEDITNVSGIGDSKFESIKDFITV